MTQHPLRWFIVLLLLVLPPAFAVAQEALPEDGAATAGSPPGTTATLTVPAGDAAALIAAINTANGNGEADTIVLGGGTYTFYDPNNYWYGPNALPAISSAITIEGNGAILERSSTATSRFRLFYVDGGLSGLTAGTLTLRNMTIRNGYAEGGSSWYGGGGLGAGGAIFNQGTLVLEGVTISGNTAQGGGIAPIVDWPEGGGGMGESSTGIHGGGFGGPAPGAAGGRGGVTYGTGGGGGGGFSAQGQDVAGADGGAGGGASRLGGTGGYTPGYSGAPGIGQDGGGGGGGSLSGGGGGGAFGQGGTGASSTPAGGGGGGVGGGGGRSAYGAGGGGFGGGGAGNCYNCGGMGGFGGGGGSTGGAGGFGGHDGCAVMAGPGAGMGGAIFNMYGSVQASGCTLSGNAANGGASSSSICGSGSGVGGGIFNLDGAVSLTNCTVIANSASQSAAALYNLAYANTPSGGASTASMTLADSTVTDLVNNQDRSRNGANVASATLAMDGTGPTNLIPSGVANYGGASQSGTAASGCFAVLYGDPAGSCGGLSPCYTKLWRIRKFVCDGGTISFSGGVYGEALTVDRNLTVNLGGDIEFPGSVTQSSGALNASPGTWTIRGDLLLNGGTFNPGGGTVSFSGGGSQTSGGSGPLSLRNVVVGDACAARWKLDEGSGTAAGDSSGGGHAGTLYGNPAWMTAGLPPVAYPDPAALSFDGADDQIQVPHSTALDFGATRDFSVSLWVKMGATAAYSSLVSNKSSYYQSNQPGWILSMSSTPTIWRVDAWDGNGRFLTESPVPINDNQWHHLVASFDRDGTLVLYQDGAPVGSSSISGMGNVDSGQPVTVGRLPDGGYPYTGAMDDIRILGKALSAAEVLVLYNGGVEGHWKLDEGSGATSFADTAGRGHPGSCAGGACPTAGQPGVSGAAVYFDGANDEIEVPHSAALDFGSTQDFSVSLWVKMGATQAFSSFVSNKISYYSSAQKGWILSMNDTPTSWRADAWDGANRFLVSASTPVNDGQWHHLAATFDRDGDLILYQDGVVAGSGSIAGMGDVTTSQPVTFGRLPDGGYPYGGMMDDVRIYKRALTATDVAVLAAGKSPAGTLNTLALGQPLDAGGTVTLSEGTLDAGTGNQSITIGGDWMLNGGSFEPRQGTVTFNGSGTQNLTGDTGFHSLTVGSGSILTTSSDVAVSGTLTNLGWTDETKSITGTGSKTWGLAGIATDVTTPGTLSALRVLRRDQNHPNASALLRTGKYWTITPTGTGYSVDLTLPLPPICCMSSPLACRYSSGRWDYGRTSFTPTTVTRGGVTAFSDWAVSDGEPSPPPVGDGRNGGAPALFSKNATIPGQIDVTYDATHCSADRAVILYGTLGDFSGYAGSAQCVGGNTGSTTIDSSAPTNVWFDILWQNALTSGNPGYGFDGTSDVPRTWSAMGHCDTMRDLQDWGSCP